MGPVVGAPACQLTVARAVCVCVCVVVVVAVGDMRVHRHAAGEPDRQPQRARGEAGAVATMGGQEPQAVDVDRSGP